MTIVLVHGLTASTDWWRPTITALGDGRDVRLVDLPGVPPREASGRLLEWLQSETLGPASLVGHSMGGAVALLAAAERPEAVDRLVLIAPAGVFASRRRRSFVVPLARSTIMRGPAALPTMVRDVLRIGPRRLWRVASDLVVTDVGPSLTQVRAPTLIIWGARDRLLPPELGRAFCDQIPDCRLIVLPRAAHIPMLEAPDELAAALLAFLEEGQDETR